MRVFLFLNAYLGWKEERNLKLIELKTISSLLMEQIFGWHNIAVE
jgi:hypothetical protein